MILVRDLKKFYGNKPILDGITCEFSEGQTHVLIGPSGSGKSSLLRSIMGLLSFDEGDVEINGRSVQGFSGKSWLHRIGYVPQDGGLFPHLTTRDNILIVAKTLNWRPSQIETRLTQLMEAFSFSGQWLSRYPSQLSGGQAQRASLLRAAFLDPEIMILDEPLSSLDPIVRAGLREELKHIFRKLNKTVLFVTHDLVEASYLGDTITLVYRGKILQSGSFEDFLERPKHPFVTEFVNAQRLAWK